MRAIKWQRIQAITLALACLAALIAVSQISSRWQPTPDPRPGWKVIRPPHEVSALAEQGGRIWAGGQEGVYAIDRSTGRLLSSLETNPSLENVHALLADGEDDLWVGHDQGLTHIAGKVTRTYTEADGLPDRRVNALMRDREGLLWVGTWGGAASFDGHEFVVLTMEDGLIDDMVNVMIQDWAGGLWFGSYVAPRGGISVLNAGRWQHFSRDNGLPHNNVTSLFEDDSGSVWAGTGLLNRGGAVRFDRTDGRWIISQTLSQDDGLAGAKARSIFQTTSGALWFGSEYDGLTRWDGTTWSTFAEADGVAAAEVKAMLQDANDTLWLGTTDGVTRISASALSAMGSALP